MAALCQVKIECFFLAHFELTFVPQSQYIYMSSHAFSFFSLSLFETSQSLFWASFGLVDLMAFELQGIKSFTRFWAMLMFGSYSVINIIVLLNMLIAMMSNSYQIISVSETVRTTYLRLIKQSIAFKRKLRRILTGGHTGHLWHVPCVIPFNHWIFSILYPIRIHICRNDLIRSGNLHVRSCG